MRIAFVADTLHSGVSGGVLSGENFVRALRDRHEVAVVGADRRDDELGLRLPGFMLPLHAMRAMQFTMAWPSSSAIREVVEWADVVHLQFPFMASWAALGAARRLHKPTVAAFHVQPENALMNVGVRSETLARLLYRLTVHRFYNRSDVVLAPSKFAERKLVEHGLTQPSWVISNGVPDDLGAGPGHRAPGDDGAFVVMMAGRYAAEKRQDLLLDAVARSRHRERIRVVLAGTGPREAALRAQGATLPHPPTMGFFSREELGARLRGADLFVHASEVELEGMAVLEATRLGVPTLIADAPQSAASGLARSEPFRFPAGDAAALAAKIDWLIENPALRSQERRLDFAEADFGAQVARLEALYRMLARQSLPLVTSRRAPRTQGG